MLTATATTDGFRIDAVTNGLAVYLDHWALCDLAEGDEELRSRFVNSVKLGADLLFSVTNAAELVGPQGKSLLALRNFLDRIGHYWTPVEMDATEVVKREQRGEPPTNTCISTRFIRDYFNSRLGDFPTENIIDMSANFFKLGAVLDWLGEQRDSIRSSTSTFDTALANRIALCRAKHESDPDWLDSSFPALAYDVARPATSLYVNLIRNLILEKETLAKNDGMDFFHTMIGAAFANAAALDQHWKRRVENIPQPNGFAKIYYAPELGQMVSDVEEHVQLYGRPPRR